MCPFFVMDTDVNVMCSIFTHVEDYNDVDIR